MSFIGLLFYHGFLELRTELTEEQILKALEVEPPTEAVFARFMERYAKGPEAVPHKEATQFFFSLRSRYLRHFVHTWLDSGLRSDGSESPGDRNLTGRILLDLRDYIEKNPPKILVSPISGKLSASMGNLPKGSARPANPFLGAHFDALRFFSTVVSGESKEYLCKCRHAPCGRFFFLEKPRPNYRHGTFCCREHQALASSLVCTRQKRDRLTRRLIDLAAQQLLQWRFFGPRWQEDVKLKRRLAEALSVPIEKDPNLQNFRPEVKRNWVTRNRALIEQRRLQLVEKQRAGS